MLRKHPGREAQLTEEESGEKFTTTYKIAHVWFEFLDLFIIFFS